MLFGRCSLLLLQFLWNYFTLDHFNAIVAKPTKTKMHKQILLKFFFSVLSLHLHSGGMQRKNKDVFIATYCTLCVFSFFLDNFDIVPLVDCCLFKYFFVIPYLPFKFAIKTSQYSVIWNIIVFFAFFL